MRYEGLFMTDGRESESRRQGSDEGEDGETHYVSRDVKCDGMGWVGLIVDRKVFSKPYIHTFLLAPRVCYL
jgi:hypothetical protein